MKPRLKPFILVAALAAVLLAGADIVHRAKNGHGHWHQLARSLYHAVKGSRAQAASLPSERADAPLSVYDDTLGDGWDNWSWSDKTLHNPGPDLNHPSPVHTGKAAIFLPPPGNRAIYLHHGAFGTGGYGALQAFVYGDPAAQVCLVDDGGKFLPYAALTSYLHPDPAGRPGWHLVRLPLAALGVPRSGQTISGIVFQPDVNARMALVVDDVSFLPDLSLPSAPMSATVALTVNVRAGRHPISPFIYGMAMAPEDYVADLHLPLNRWGGNDKTRYDWVQGNADNAARDWGFRNRLAVSADPPHAPSSAADAFVRADEAHGAATLLTVPTIGWVARDTDNAHASANVPGSGGPGLAGADGPIAGYDPAANRSITSVRSVARKGAPFVASPTLAGGVVYQDEWIHHLKTTFGDGAHGGVQFYAMDNEPDLWDGTHTDVHPASMGYDDMLHNFLDYATAVKAVDPAALITGPVSWGWTGYNYSALDRGSDNFKTHADQTRHGGVLFLPWFLRQVHAHDIQAGRRTLDILDVHFYPQANGVYGGQTDKATQSLRLRSTRSLWDPSYADESWVGVPVRLIPRMNEWIAQSYPGTRLGITEWNFGADTHINGGLAIADVLGIFGREDVYLADYWAYPNKDSPGYLAFKLYRSPDGRGNGFGDIACAASSADQSRLAIYAATDSRTGELTLMLINKMAKATITAPLVIHGATPTGTVKMWRCDADNPKGIAAYPSVPLSSVLILPPQSMTLLRLPLRPATNMNALLQKLAALDAAPDGAEEPPALSAMPTAEEYAAQAQTHARLFLLGGGLLAGLVAAAFVAFGLDNILLPIVFLIVVLTPILLWRFPRLTLYWTLAAVCLLEVEPVRGLDGLPFADALTDRVPFFWNINTILQTYMHLDFKAIPLNLFEVFILVACVCSCLRAVYNQTVSLRGGALLVPVVVYMLFVLIGWFNGMLTGGDFKISLQEVRSQFYFGLAYFLAVNLVRDRRQLGTVLWTVAACTAFKGILLTLRRYVTLHGMPLPDQGIGAHEEVFFFDVFVILLLVLSVFGAYPRLRWSMTALLPFVLIGSLACNRRAGTAAFIVIIPVLVLAAYQAMPARRRLIAALSVACLALFAGYYVTFKNSDALIAQPARAINSQFNPDPRDASSNEYRDAENADLMATIHSAPVQGYGYGKRILHAVPIADISKEYEWWDIMTHNQVLWVWMRVGTLGFLAYWVMISAILICAARTVRDPSTDPQVKSAALAAMLIVGALQVFGLLDLQLSNFRDMLFAGLWAGIAAALPGLALPTLRKGGVGR